MRKPPSALGGLALGGGGCFGRAGDRCGAHSEHCLHKKRELGLGLEIGLGIERGLGLGLERGFGLGCEVGLQRGLGCELGLQRGLG